MSMEFDTPTDICEERLKRPISEPEKEPEKEPKRPKSEPELGSKSEPRVWENLVYDEDPKLSEFSIYDDDIEPYYFICENFEYKNNAYKKIEEADNDYIERSRNLSEYDAIPPPPRSHLCGGRGVVPVYISDDDRPILNELSQLALNYYNANNNNNQAPTFVFHEVVKCTHDVGSDDGAMHYITFQSKAKEDPSDSPALTTFQAQVWMGDDESRNVIKCAIKI